MKSNKVKKTKSVLRKGLKNTTTSTTVGATTTATTNNNNYSNNNSNHSSSTNHNSINIDHHDPDEPIITNSPSRRFKNNRFSFRPRLPSSPKRSSSQTQSFSNKYDTIVRLDGTVNSSNISGNKSNDKRYSLSSSLLSTQEQNLSPLRGSLFDLADHKIYGMSVDVMNDYDDTTTTINESYYKTGSGGGGRVRGKKNSTNNSTAKNNKSASDYEILDVYSYSCNDDSLDYDDPIRKLQPLKQLNIHDSSDSDIDIDVFKMKKNRDGNQFTIDSYMGNYDDDDDDDDDNDGEMQIAQFVPVVDSKLKQFSPPTTLYYDFSDDEYDTGTDHVDNDNGSRNLHENDGDENTNNCNDESVDTPRIQNITNSNSNDSYNKNTSDDSEKSNAAHNSENNKDIKDNNNNFRNTITSPDEVHALNKKKRLEFMASQRRSMTNATTTNAAAVATTTSIMPTTKNASIAASEKGELFLSPIKPMATASTSTFPTSSPPLLLPPRMEAMKLSTGGIGLTSPTNNKTGSNSVFTFSPWTSTIHDDDDNDNNVSSGVFSHLNIDTSAESVGTILGHKNDDDNDGKNKVAAIGRQYDNGIEHNDDRDNSYDQDVLYRKQQQDDDDSEEGESPFPDDPLADLQNGGFRSHDNNIELIDNGGEDNDNNANICENSKKGSTIFDDSKSNNDKERKKREKVVPNDNGDDIIIPSPIESPQFENKSHPGSVRINDNTDQSISSSIGESTELLTMLNILPISEFVKLNDAQRIQAYRALMDTSAETITEIDEKRTEIFSMGRQVDELSRRVSDLMETKFESQQKMKAYRKEIDELKGILSTSDEKINSMQTEMNEKNVIIDALKESIDKHTSSKIVNSLSKSEELPSAKETGSTITTTSNNKASKSFKSRTATGKSVRERIREFERERFGDKLEQMKLNRKEKDELSGRVKDLSIELEAKDSIINELKDSLQQYTSPRALGSGSYLNDSSKDDIECQIENKADDSVLIQNEKLLSKVKELMAQLDEKDNTISDLRNLNESLLSANDDANEVESFKTAKNDCLEKLQSDIEVKDKALAKLSNELNLLKERITNEQTLHQNHQQSLEILQGEIKEKDYELDNLTKQLHHVKKSLANEQSSNSELQQSLETLKSNLKEKDVELKTLANDLDKMMEIQSSDGERNQSLNKLLYQIKEKDEALEKLTNELDMMKEKDVKKTEFYQKELKSVQEKFVHNKLKELERANIENEELTEKLEEFERICLEKEKLLERVNELEQISEENKNLQEQLQLFNETIAEKDQLSERMKEFEQVCSENEQLAKRVKQLEVEIGDVSGLLEETFKSVKQINESSTSQGFNLGEQIQQLGPSGKALFRRTPGRSTNNNNEPALTKLQQLQRMCVIHQQTVLRQKAEIDKLQEILNEKDTQLNELRIQAGIDQEKITALETQFIQLNQSPQDKEEPFENFESNTDAIKVDKAYIESLQAQSEKDADIIEEFKNQISVLKSRNDTLNEKIGLEDDLRHEIEDLKTKLQACNLIIEGLEKSYHDYNNTHLPGGDRASQQERTENSNIDTSKSTTILSLNKVMVSQELQTASIRRLHDLVKKLGENNSRNKAEESLIASNLSVQMEPDGSDSPTNTSIIISLSDKLSLLHEYLKVSLHLLECKLSNDVESVSSMNSKEGNAETDAIVSVRFEQALESMKEIEKEMQCNLDVFEKEIQHQDIKISAKDGVIEKLLKTDERLNEKIKDLQAELDVFKSLSAYSSVNTGVMARFQESFRLEKELHEKNVEIRRLRAIVKGE